MANAWPTLRPRAHVAETPELHVPDTPSPEMPPFEAVPSIVSVGSSQQARTGGTHKTDLERSLTTARAKIQMVLDKSWVVLGPARKELEAAATLVRMAEVELGNLRLVGRRGGVSGRKDPLEQLWEDDAGHTQDSRRWLLETFTGADLEAAEGHQVGSSPSVKTGDTAPRWRSRTRVSVQDMDLSLAQTLVDPEAKACLERFGRLDFDSMAFGELPLVAGRPVQVLSVYTVQKRQLVSALARQGRVPEEHKFREALYNFFQAIEELYKPVPYHSNVHAADVLMTMEWFLETDYLRERVSTLDHLMAVVAAVIHDVGHPGRNNLFYSKTMGALAVTYNDKSVLENMHLALSFETMQKDPQCNWFGLLSRAYRRPDDDPSTPTVNLQQYVRRGLIDLVLATDMAKHADHVRQLRDYVEAVADEASLETPASKANKKEALERKLLLLETALHAADISNPCKPRPIMLRWTERVLAEFWAQGDEERRLGVEVSPLCDRESGRQAIAQGQIGFINFVVAPFFTPIAELIPEAKEATELLDETKAFWTEVQAMQVPPEEIFRAEAK